MKAIATLVFSLVSNVETQVHSSSFLDELLINCDGFTMKQLLLIIEENPENLGFQMPFGVEPPLWLDAQVDFQDSLSNRFQVIFHFNMRNVFAISLHLIQGKFVCVFAQKCTAIGVIISFQKLCNCYISLCKLFVNIIRKETVHLLLCSHSIVS